MSNWKEEIRKFDKNKGTEYSQPTLNRCIKRGFEEYRSEFE